MKQLASAGQVGGALAVGEQAVVADAMEALGQDVDQEAADELVGGQRHRLVSARPVDAVVLVSEGDAALVGLDEAVIRDGDAVGVARQIGEYGLGPAERLLGVDHPLGLAQRLEIGIERSALGESPMIGEEPETAGGVRCAQHLEEEAAEQA